MQAPIWHRRSLSLHRPIGPRPWPWSGTPLCWPYQRRRPNEDLIISPSKTLGVTQGSGSLVIQEDDAPVVAGHRER